VFSRRFFRVEILRIVKKTISPGPREQSRTGILRENSFAEKNFIATHIPVYTTMPVVTISPANRKTNEEDRGHHQTL
jgi:hypothetical protein